MFVPFDALSDDSKVWIYQADRPLTEDECLRIRNDLAAFVDEWTAHNVALHAHGDVFHHRFIVLFADERYQNASGCSVDRSVHFIEQLERAYQISLFGRTQVIWRKEGSALMETAELNELANLYQSGAIADSTLMFDNLVNTKKQFVSAWIKPLQESWQKRFAG
jgi:hypothetical protein